MVEDPDFSNLCMIATHSSVASIYMSTGTTKTTFKMTYYTVRNNNWYSGCNSWKCETLSTDLIPLENTITFCIYT